MAVLLVVVVAVSAAWAARCPRDLGIAINSGDKRALMERVEFTLSDDGWIGNPTNGLAEAWSAKEPFPVIVFSSLLETSLPFRNNNNTRVPVSPCCGNVDLSASLGTAQLMREHTWRAMLDYFSNTTDWFVSTEDDAWWDIRGLCTLLDGIESDHDPRTPIIVGGGMVARAIYGPYIVMNRPMLELYANDTLLSACRDSFLKPGTNAYWRDVYSGAPYNLDHFVSYCAFSCFPRMSPIIHLIQLPNPVPPHTRPYENAVVTQWPDFLHNGHEWKGSRRAPYLAATFEDPDFLPIAIHHTTIEDIGFLEKRATAIYASGRAQREINASCCHDEPRKKLTTSCCPEEQEEQLQRQQRLERWQEARPVRLGQSFHP